MLPRSSIAPPSRPPNCVSLRSACCSTGWSSARSSPSTSARSAQARALIDVMTYASRASVRPRQLARTQTFWTVFVTKAVLFTAVFAVSTLLLWVNGALALRFASQRRLRLPAALRAEMSISDLDNQLGVFIRTRLVAAARSILGSSPTWHWRHE